MIISFIMRLPLFPLFPYVPPNSRETEKEETNEGSEVEARKTKKPYSQEIGGT